MDYNDHSQLRGTHAFLSASSYHWTNYTPEKLRTVYTNYKATQKGTRLHDFAEECIRLRIKLPDLNLALNKFVNDAIGFRMQPEHVLYYSEYAFGTADALRFHDGLLRIHDLKTGVTKVSMRQLHVYASLFCLEYHEDPRDIDIILRIYQGQKVMEEKPNPDDISHVMKTIVEFDKIIRDLDRELE